MAIQTTTDFTYNYGTYTNPYFRLVLHIPANGQQTSVDTFMYPSYESFTSGSSHIACLPHYVTSSVMPVSTSGSNVMNEYLYAISEEVVTNLLTPMSPSSSFEIVGIPTK
jgi:hypothetical protein